MSAFSEATNLAISTWDFGMVNPAVQDEVERQRPEFEVFGESEPKIVADVEQLDHSPTITATADNSTETPGNLWRSFEPELESQESPIEIPTEIQPVETNIVAAVEKKSPTTSTRSQILSKLWLWTRSRVKIQARKKRLKVCETVSLGEKRFIAVVQVDGSEFLVGGAPNALSVLAQLETQKTFPEILRQSCEQPAQA